MPPPSFDDEIEKQRRADEGREDAERDLARGKAAGQIVDQHQKARAQQHRARQQPLRVLPDEQPADMWDHEPHPADHAADGDARRGRQRGAEDDEQAQQPGVDAHAAGLRLADGQKIQPPPQKKKSGIRPHKMGTMAKCRSSKRTAVNAPISQ